jgi:hypothetical protein
MKVKIRSIDDRRTDLFYTTRSVDIRPASKTIKTPIRALTNGDLNAKAGAPLDIPLNAPIAGIHFKLKTKDVQGIFSKNATSNNLINKIEAFLQQMQHSDIVIPLIQPPSTSFGDILEKEADKRTFFRLINQIQKFAGLSTICVPWLAFSREKTVRFYDEILQNSDDNFIFYLDADANPDDLEYILKFIKQQIETERIQFVGILHQPVRKALRSYDVVWESLKGSDVGIVLSDIERVDIHNPISAAYVSSSHLNEFIVGDVFMSRVSGGGGGKPSQTPVSHRLKIFNSKELSVKPIEKYSDKDWIQNITQTIPDNTLSRKLENYQEADIDQEKYNILNYVTKVHEFILSSDEFVKSQEYINKEESSVYIKQKSALNVALSKARNQKKLNGFFRVP